MSPVQAISSAQCSSRSARSEGGGLRWLWSLPRGAWCCGSRTGRSRHSPATARRRSTAALPIAVIEHNLVAACSASARAEGVRRGQRRRDAQARCPGLTVVAADAARDHRAFAPVVTRIEEHAPGVQVVRPGLCALRARGPARYYGGETEAARMLLGVLREAGLDGVRAGVADGPFTAEQAAKAATTAAEPVFVVPAGGAAGFLAPLSVAVLEASSLGAGSSLSPGGAGRPRGAARPARRADPRRVRGDGAGPRAGAVRGARHPSARLRRRERLAARPAAHAPARAAPRGRVRAAARDRRPGRVRHADGRRRVHRGARRDRPRVHRAARGARRRPRRAQRAGLAASRLVRCGGRGRPGAVAARRRGRASSGERRAWGCAAGSRSCGSLRRRWMRHPIMLRRSSDPDPRSACTTLSRACRRCSGIGAS